MGVIRNHPGALLDDGCEERDRHLGRNRLRKRQMYVLIQPGNSADVGSGGFRLAEERELVFWWIFNGLMENGRAS